MKKYNKYIYFFVIIALCGAICFQVFNISRSALFTSGTKPTNWGVFYLEDGKKPRGNATEDYLKQFDAYFIAPTDEKILYLTFDSGYENGYTSKILDVLNKQKVPATFFLTGHYVKTNAELVVRMINENFTVGNHSMTHPDMSAYNFESFKKEIQGFESVYKEATSLADLKYYRPPCGIYSENNLKYAKELGYKTILWSSAYHDWDNNNQPAYQNAIETMMPRIHPGAIILLHSTSKTNSEILEEFIKKCRAEGYTFKSLDDLP